MIKNNYLILVRHGQSTYNLDNKFTGWKDVELTNKGKNEAKLAIDLLKNININKAYTSALKRAQDTLNIILKGLDIKLDVITNYKLNERDYGDLVGQNKLDAAKKFGSKQVQIWRRSYDVSPPGGESLKMTYDRCIPYFKSVILQDVFKHNNVIISAHGNSIRAIVKFLLNLSSDEILKTEIGWCEPWVFEFNSSNNLVNLDILHNDEYESNSKLPIALNSLFKSLNT
jgi:2,3-bisphosphoglycerate-dependent phosphoglycerate mutase